MNRKKKYSDHELFTFTASKQRKYFILIYDYYSPILYGLLLNAGLSEKYSSDILEMTFIKIWNQDSLPSGDISYLSWMITITIRTTLEYMDKEKRKYKICIRNSNLFSIQFTDVAQPLLSQLYEVS